MCWKITFSFKQLLMYKVILITRCLNLMLSKIYFALLLLTLAIYDLFSISERILVPSMGRVFDGNLWMYGLMFPYIFWYYYRILFLWTLGMKLIGVSNGSYYYYARGVECNMFTSVGFSGGTYHWWSCVDSLGKVNFGILEGF